MKLYPRDDSKMYSSEEVGYALIHLIEKNLEINRWKFRLAFTNLARTNAILVIYNSEWCRMKFMFSLGHTSQHDELSISYGRLHAVNEEPFMGWEEQECRCWHFVIDPLNFLDGLSPAEAVKQTMIYKELPTVIKDFRQSSLGKKLIAEYAPKSAIVMHSVIWKHYGSRLFELFDLRRPDLWEEYRKFHIEYHRLLGTKTIYGPPIENIC